MPSMPRADSPYADSQVNRLLGARMPGTPSTAGKAGGVQPAKVSFPAPPGLQAGAPGRPPSTPGPTPGAGTPSPTPAPAPSTPAAPGVGSQQSVQAKAMQGQQPGQAPPADQNMGGVQSGIQGLAMDRMPAPGEMLPGTSVQTPFGTARKDPQTGASKLTLSPEGQQKYREAKAKLRQKLGPLPGLLQNPGMPQLPVEVGQFNYNPFTGKMERG